MLLPEVRVHVCCARCARSQVTSPLRRHPPKLRTFFFLSQYSLHQECISTLCTSSAFVQNVPRKHNVPGIRFFFLVFFSRFGTHVAYVCMQALSSTSRGGTTEAAKGQLPPFSANSNAKRKRREKISAKPTGLAKSNSDKRGLCSILSLDLD